MAIPHTTDASSANAGGVVNAVVWHDGAVLSILDGRCPACSWRTLDAKTCLDSAVVQADDVVTIVVLANIDDTHDA